MTAERVGSRGRFGAAHQPVVDGLRRVGRGVPERTSDQLKISIWINLNSGSVEAATRVEQRLNQRNVALRLKSLPEEIRSDLGVLSEKLGVSKNIAFAIRLGLYPWEFFTEDIQQALGRLFDECGV